MKNFIKILFLTILFLSTLTANASIYTDFYTIEKQNSKIEFLSNKKSETFFEISKNRDLIFLKNENNEEISASNNQNSNSSGNFTFTSLNNNILLNTFFVLHKDLNSDISYAIPCLFKYSIQNRAP